MQHPSPDSVSQDSELDFTIAICTYNGAERIPAVLEYLSRQTGVSRLAWEIIIVDNRSTDATATVVAQCQKSWPLAVPLRYLFEPRQGAAYARHHAVRMAHSPLIGFLDDDNLPAENWVAAAFAFAQQHPTAGVYGSRIQGDFEGRLPLHFDRIAPFLALTERGDDAHIYEPAKKVLPPGAGLVVRRDLWLACVPPEPVLIGRTPGSMVGGEDLEAVLYIQQAGWEVWYNPSMRVNHKIPKHRLEHDYLVGLMRGAGLSRQRTRMLSVSPWKRPILFWAYHAHDIYKILRHIAKYRLAVLRDTVAISELNLYVFSFLSPYYIWHRELLKWIAKYRAPQPSRQPTPKNG